MKNQREKQNRKICLVKLYYAVVQGISKGDFPPTHQRTFITGKPTIRILGYRDGGGRGRKTLLKLI